MSSYNSYQFQVNSKTGEPFLSLPAPHSNIILTPPRLDEADEKAAVQYLNDLNIAKWLQGPPFPYNLDHARKWMEKTHAESQAILQEINQNPPGAFINGCPFKILREVKEDGQDILIGDCSINPWIFEELLDPQERSQAIEQNQARNAGDPLKEWSFGGNASSIVKSSNIDYLASSHHGKGIMSLAIKTLIEQWAMPRMGAKTIKAGVFIENIPSRKVFEKNSFVLWKTVEDCVLFPESKGGGMTGIHIMKLTLVIIYPQGGGFPDRNVHFKAQISLDGVNGIATFGVLDPNSLLDNTTPIQIPEVIVKWLTDALILHIVAFVLAAISAIFGLLAHIREFATVYCSTFISGLAAAVALIAFIFDIAFFFLTKARINNIKGASAQTGNAIWLTLAAWLLLFFAGCFYTIGRCCIVSRPRGPRVRDPSNDIDTRRAEAVRLDAVKAEADRKAQQKQREMGLPAFQEYDSRKPLTLEDDEPYHDGQVSPRQNNFSSSGYFPQPTNPNPGYVPAPLGTSARDAYYAGATAYPPPPNPPRQQTPQQYNQGYANIGGAEKANSNLYNSQNRNIDPSGHSQYPTSHTQYATAGHEQYPPRGHNQYPSAAAHTQYPSTENNPYPAPGRSASAGYAQYPPGGHEQFTSNHDQYPLNDPVGSYDYTQYNPSTYLPPTVGNSQQQYSTSSVPTYQEQPRMSSSPSPTDYKLPPGIVPGQTSMEFGLLHASQVPLSDESKVPNDSEPWGAKYGPQIDLPFTGPLSFSHIPYTRCLDDPSKLFDIAILGMPFDTAVSYRPGARFGPYAIRSGSRRQRDIRGYTLNWQINPYEQGSKIIDCGDVPISPFDNALALDQMEVAYTTLLKRPVAIREEGIESSLPLLGNDGKEHPRIISLGGDHTIGKLINKVLPILRSLYQVYDPISVIHFDAHLDTWSPLGYPGADTIQAHSNHGTFFWVAAQEGLISNTSIHAGIRTKLMVDHAVLEYAFIKIYGTQDIRDDESVGFELITTDDIDDYGVQDIIQRIRKRVGSSPIPLWPLPVGCFRVFLTPLLKRSKSVAGTPEAGGWTMREVKRIIRGLAGLNFVGVDLVEVSPSYDHAEITGIAAADLVHDFLSMLLTTRQELNSPEKRNTDASPSESKTVHRDEF
ncbi:hypothetical protein Clacol_003831 [Clathrus columnatus]|uniref:N-acetyltransferase domain-containing protein n=1 Tax=Clathrus columnatus TaxID=1419009 RepID=A0AAV5A8U7_9AGAM|nr:hypothetical protein Clacol_003831 [Clathrus columnatus]